MVKERTAILLRRKRPLSRGRGSRLILGLFLLFLSSPVTRSQGLSGSTRGGQETGKKEKEEPAGELLLFQDIPMVVSAGREATSQALSPAPVSVFTSEEIEWAGLTSIPEILQFLPGMDMIRIDRLRYAVGVRGLHSFGADRTLALIDGRNATHPAWGGTFYNFLPVMVEDIDRIEVVRGPIGAAWGANAFNGAVNIITKKPEDTRGITITGKVDEYGDNRTFFRWGSTAGDLDWRVSASLQHSESSSDAMSGEDFESNDSYKAFRFDGKGSWKMGKEDILSFGAAHAWNRIGDFEQLGYWVREKGRVEITRFFAKQEHTFETGTTAYIQAFCNRENDFLASEGRISSAEYDLETQVTGIWENDHRLTIGGNFRFITVNPKQPRDPQEIRMLKDTIHEYWTGLFLSDSWALDEKTSLDFQLRGDQYSGTGMDWSGRASWIEEIEDRERQVLRFSIARSFRAPSTIFRQMGVSRLPLGGGFYAYNLQANQDLENEEIYSIEGGYSWIPADNISLKVNTYYQFLDDLINAENPSPTIFRLENSGSGRAYGGEFEADSKVGPARLGVWFGYNGFHSRKRGKNYRAFRPADYKAGAKGRLSLPAGFHLSCLYRYSDAVQTPAVHHLPVVHRVDLTLSKVFLDGRATFQLGASDLFNRADPKIYGLGNLTAHKTPGRTFFTRLVLSF